MRYQINTIEEMQRLLLWHRDNMEFGPSLAAHGRVA
jgi:hypothetical protein